MYKSTDFWALAVREQFDISQGRPSWKASNPERRNDEKALNSTMAFLSHLLVSGLVLHALTLAYGFSVVSSSSHSSRMHTSTPTESRPTCKITKLQNYKKNLIFSRLQFYKLVDSTLLWPFSLTFRIVLIILVLVEQIMNGHLESSEKGLRHTCITQWMYDHMVTNMGLKYITASQFEFVVRLLRNKPCCCSRLPEYILAWYLPQSILEVRYSCVSNRCFIYVKSLMFKYCIR